MFDDIFTSIQRWFCNAKMRLNADKSKYMNIRKCKIVKHILLRLLENGDYIEYEKVLVCNIDCHLTLQRQINFVWSNLFFYLRKVWSICDQVKISVLVKVLVL